MFAQPAFFILWAGLQSTLDESTICRLHCPWPAPQELVQFVRELRLAKRTDHGRQANLLAALVTGLAHPRPPWLSPRTLRLRLICCRESYQDGWTVRSAAEGVVASVHIREVGGSSPLAPTTSPPLSSWFARRGNREDYAFFRGSRPH
jgi:hypothetical protein